MPQLPKRLDRTSLCWGSVPEAGLVELAALASRHGFPEISVRPGHYIHAREAEDWLERLAATGVTVGVIDALLGYLPGSPHSEEFGNDVAELDACLEAAVQLGARTLNVAHYRGDPTVGFDQMSEAVSEIASRVEHAGVRCSLEFIPGTGIPDLETVLRLMEEADSSAVGVMFDTWHHIRVGGTSSELSALETGQVFEVQISGRRTPSATDEYVPMTGRLAPGQGDAPVAELVRELWAVDAELVLGLEVFTAERGEMDMRVAHLAGATRTFLTEEVFS